MYSLIVTLKRLDPNNGNINFNRIFIFMMNLVYDFDFFLLFVLIKLTQRDSALYASQF